MKSIKLLLVLVLLFVITESRRVKRSKSKRSLAQSMTRAYNGGGSWSAGFDLPGVVIHLPGKSYNEDDRLLFGKIKGGDIKAAQGAHSRALVINKNSKSNGLKGLAKEYFFEEDDTYVLPLRFITTAVTYSNPSGYKKLKFSVTNDSQKVAIVTMLLPWKWAGWYINDEEGTKIAKYISANRTNYVHSINVAKNNVGKAGLEFCANNTLLKAANDKEAEKAKLEERKAALQQEIADLVAEVGSETQAYETHVASCSEVNSAWEAKNKEVTVLSTQWEAKKSLVEKAENATDITTTGQIVAAKASMTKHLNDLIALNKSRASIFKGAVDTFLSDYDFESFDAKFFPSNLLA